MSKKYVIEIKPEYEDTTKGVMVLGARDSNLYVDTLAVENLEELNSDYINKHFGDMQDTAYQRGLEEGKKATWELVADASSAEYQRGLDDAWEAAKKLFSSMTDYDIEKAFPIEWNNGGFKALMNLQPQEAITKLKAYEEKQKADDKIVVGDEVKHNRGWVAVVTQIDELGLSCVDRTGAVASYDDTSKFRKTGRHFSVEKILEEMRK